MIKIPNNVTSLWPVREISVPLSTDNKLRYAQKRRGREVLAVLRFVVLPVFGHVIEVVAWLAFIGVLCYLGTIAY